MKSQYGHKFVLSGNLEIAFDEPPLVEITQLKRVS